MQCNVCHCLLWPLSVLFVMCVLTFCRCLMDVDFSAYVDLSLLGCDLKCDSPDQHRMDVSMFLAERFSHVEYVRGI